jgi:histidine ammonia-lyase
MQAWELKLLEPVINDAIRETEKASRPAYQVIAWLHDGFALAVSKNKASIERRMKRLVQKQADRLGIPTYLETEWL